jgi:asparagine synthetase B (glutamine-hydrolysing)
MIFYCGAPFLTLIAVLILWKIADILEKRDIKKLEKEMRERGIDENTIFVATKFMKL